MKNFKPRYFKTKCNEEVIIRSAEVMDARQILDLSKSVVAEDIYQLLTVDELDLTVASEEDWITSHREHPNRLIIVAELNDEIIGLLDFCNGSRRRTSHTGEFGMSMAKSKRGQGIGTEMIKALIEWATHNADIEKINLTVHSNNESARNLYQKLGFKVEGVKEREIKYENGEYVNAVLMGRFVK